MAKQLTFESTTGAVYQYAYFKIDEYSCDKNNTIRARIRAYVNRELALSGATPIEGSEEIIEINGDYSDEAVNAKKQVYDYLSTLDKYKEAINVLE